VATASPDPDRLLEPLRADPARSAVLSDVDGTLAPIVEDPAAATVLPAARDALAALASRYALVGCVSGRRAIDARGLVGVDGLTYLGNHGLERLEPGSGSPRASAALDGHEDDVAAFLGALDPEPLTRAGVRVEDKGPIRALHWRGADDEEVAERAAADLAEEARRAGLAVHRGRKVLELRPPVAFDKGLAIVELLREHPVRHALYAGDDRTDLDGFRALREGAASGELDTAVCVAIASAEAPPEVAAAADLIVADSPSFAALLAGLARD
jgi:trehalose 6-phosphate phosphatase